MVSTWMEWKKIYTLWANFYSIWAIFLAVVQNCILLGTCPGVGRIQTVPPLSSFHKDSEIISDNLFLVHLRILSFVYGPSNSLFEVHFFAFSIVLVSLNFTAVLNFKSRSSSTSR